MRTEIRQDRVLWPFWAKLYALLLTGSPFLPPGNQAMPDLGAAGAEVSVVFAKSEHGVRRHCAFSFLPTLKDWILPQESVVLSRATV